MFVISRHFCFAWVVVTVFLGLSGQVAIAQLRVVSYNTASPNTARLGSSTVLEAIGSEVVNGFSKPIDVLLLQEQGSVSVSTQSFVDILNDLYDPVERTLYARGVKQGATSGAGRPGIVYNTETVQLIAEAGTGIVATNAQARETLVYQMRPVGYDSSADFYLYNDHYKAGTSSSDKSRRESQATNVRFTADFFPEGTPIIYAGDFNIRSDGSLPFLDTDLTYQILASEGNGQAFDPINRTGYWSNSSSFQDVHTQAPASNPGSGLVGGGVDDRFDFQLVTSEWLDGEGLGYLGPTSTGLEHLEHSYHTFGNNGTHGCCNNSISNGSGASAQVLSALETASDHLPVVADYQIPASMYAEINSIIPDDILLNNVVEVDLLVENIADVVDAIGADELDYIVSVSGDLFGSFSSIALALSGGNTHKIVFDTSSIGLKSGTVTVESSSQAVANRLIEIPIVFQVSIGPEADINGDGNVDGQDYLILQRDNSLLIPDWLSQYGNNTASSVVIPEPTSLVLFALGTVGLLASRKRG